ncbi:hypothetical protein NMY22_g19751 [Coprinellus aureogranulatus]|nr:hypothetical protein NMY22_g19751 [Coprinellus aureogranulatus]
MSLPSQSESQYDIQFPRYMPYDSPPGPWNSIAAVGVKWPLYCLGWVLKVNDVVGSYYTKMQERFILPNWRKHCKPSHPGEVAELGLMVPGVYRCGNNHIILQIARSQGQAIAHVNDNEKLKHLIKQAILGLGLDSLQDEGAFDPYKNLIWVRWPPTSGSDGFPRDASFPCIGEHHLSADQEGDGQSSDASSLPHELLRLVTAKC